MRKNVGSSFFALVLLFSFHSNGAIESDEQVNGTLQVTTKGEGCLKFASEKLNSREDCARKAGEVLMCEFNRSVVGVSSAGAELEFDAKLALPSAKTVESVFPMGTTKGKESAEILAYTYTDTHRGLSLYARATWWKSQSVCAY